MDFDRAWTTPICCSGCGRPCDPEMRWPIISDIPKPLFRCVDCCGVVRREDAQRATMADVVFGLAFMVGAVLMCWWMIDVLMLAK